MKKFLMSMALLFSVTITSFAQEQNNYAGSFKFFDNWSVGVVGGVETNLHNWNAPQGAVAGVVLHKDITPFFGFGAEVTTGINNLGNGANASLVGNHWHNKTVFDNLSAYAEGTFNISNAIFGYKGVRRPVEVEALVGVGYGHDYGTSDATNHDGLLTKAGLNLNWNPTQAFTIALRPAVVFNTATTGKYDSRYAVGQLTASVVYHFKTSNGTRNIAKAKLYNQAEVDVLNAKINALQEDLANAKATVKVVSKTDTVVKTVYPKIQFKQGSSELTETSKANVYDIADAIKDTDAKYLITGYASVEGSKEVNDKLSLARAESLKEALVKAGVPGDMLVTEVGGATNKFSPDELEPNRVAVTESK